MKKIFLSILSLCVLMPMVAQEHLCERVYVSTDRSVYVSGDEMFISAFCLDMGTRKLSSTSAIAYLEIISPEGPVQTAKVALKGGRGGGVVHLLNTIPTGNYKLVAYTAQCFNEDGYDFEEGAKTLSIINPFTTERSSAGVEMVSPEEYAAAGPAAKLPAAGSLTVETDGKVTITNTSDRSVTLSVSLYNDDGLVGPAASSIVDFERGASKGESFTQRRSIDYEGEIIRAKVRGTQVDSLSALNGSLAFLSIPGRMSDVYVSRIDGAGNATFYTHNIYGNEEAFLEVDSQDDSHLDIVSPFEGVRATGLKPLRFSSSMEDRILRRSLAMQIGSAVRVDTLYDCLELPAEGIFTEDEVTYWLDDYTRFPVMEELFIEFIRELRTKKTDNGRAVVVFLDDSFRPAPFSQLPPLVLLDGVPVLDHNKIFDYDPLLVERVVISPHTYNFGDWYYAGVVNFITYKHNLPSYEFAEGARVIDYQGVSYPVVSYMPIAAEGMPDLRQTLLWHPEVEIGPGESRVLHYTLPSYDGDFTLVVEGVDSEGTPQYLCTKLK